MGRVRLIKASAGSGKTFTLAYRYVRAVIENPERYREVLAVTFTNKATAEMKQRILAELDKLASGRQSGYLKILTDELHLDKKQIGHRAAIARAHILHDYGRFSVLTIDKFFQRIIRSFIRELGIDQNFNLELRTESLLVQAADRLIDDMAENRRLRLWITAFIEERIEQNKKWDIRSSLTDLGSEIYNETYRRSNRASSLDDFRSSVSELLARADKILTRIEQIGKEAVAAIAAAGLDISCFLYSDKGFVTYFYKAAGRRLDKPGARVLKALESVNNWCSKSSPHKGAVESVAAELMPRLAELCAINEEYSGFLNTTALIRRHYHNFILLNDLEEKLAEICREQTLLPISDTNQILGKLISGTDTPFIFEKSGNFFSHFLIDEFQDTSIMQWENFLPLIRNSLSQSDNEPVLLVGDTKQSIYRWRNSDWRIMATQVAGELETSNTILEYNYRSTPLVVEFNNELIAACARQESTMLRGQLLEACQKGMIDPATFEKLEGLVEAAYREHAQKATNSEPQGHLSITIYGIDRELKETTAPLIEKIDELERRGYLPEDIAILVRTNSQGAAVARMLLEHRNDGTESSSRYDIITQEALLINSSAVVGFTLACFRLAVGADVKVGMASYNIFLERLPDQMLSDDEMRFLAGISAQAPLEAIESVLLHFKLNERNGEILYIQALHEKVLDFTSRTGGDLRQFLKWWDENCKSESVHLPEGGSAITISSIHKSKGLQYKAVILPYCNWMLEPQNGSVIWSEGKGEFSSLGAVPVGYSKAMGESAFATHFYEEKVLSHIDNLNLLYVAVTRAEEELHIMMPSRSTLQEGNIAGIISGAVKTEGDIALVGNIQGSIERGSDWKCYSFGEPCRKPSKTSANDLTVINTGYPLYKTGERLRIKKTEHDTQPYNTIGNRELGIVMHRIFQNSQTGQQIFEKLEQLALNGVISDEQKQALAINIGTTLDSEPVKSWFSTQVNEIRSESDIILPREGGIRRPDRVVILPERTIVVDYKFGNEKRPGHTRQVEHYMQLLSSMGYPSVEGYLWYVSLGEVIGCGGK